MTETQPAKPANADQAKYWNSASGRRWIEFQEGIDTTFTPINYRLLEWARPENGEDVLDIGCGTGATTMDLAKHVGTSGSVVGIDISEPLLSHAEKRRATQQIPHLDFLLADAQTHIFDPGRFDLLASRFGVMFFEDPVAAFKNLTTALRPGGRVVFVSWANIDENPWFEAPRDAAVAQLGEPSPSSPTAPGPLAFADIDYVVDILDCAGFVACRGEKEQVQLFNPGSVEEVAYLASNIGPSARILKEFNGTPDDVLAIGHGVAKAFERYAVENGVRIPATLNFFEATRPEA